jgi:hypothetical protein
MNVFDFDMNRIVTPREIFRSYTLIFSSDNVLLHEIVLQLVASTVRKMTHNYLS